MIIETYNREDLETKRELLPWQKLGLSYTSTGYGKKIPTPTMVRLPGSPRWRRVYCCIFSNMGTCYVQAPKGNWIVIY